MLCKSKLVIKTYFTPLICMHVCVIGELGGILGLLLGASVLTVFEILDAFLYTAIVKCFDRSTRPRGHYPVHAWEAN